ncbi:MAG: hypothetical protein WAO31_05800 [Rhodoluna sp.]
MDPEVELVNPTARVFTYRDLAPRVPAHRQLQIALVDGTLNKSSLWGQGMLDAAENSLSNRAPLAVFRRIDLNPLDNPQPDLWVAATLGGSQIMIVAAGDCITCTTRGVRDAVYANDVGILAVCLVTGAVAEIAIAVATRYGLPDLPVVAIRTSLFGKSRDEVASTAAEEIGSLVDQVFT